MLEEEQPLDEVVWTSPEIVQEMGFLHTNTILPYFSRSPFFDPTSNNAVIMNQATYNPNMYPIIQKRAAFESHLRSMAGLEFVVAQDPSANDTIREHSGIWVIRKQTRRKRPGMDDEIMRHSDYFVVGDKVYMAPTIGGILESRILSTVTKLTNLFAKASTLPIFTPSTGHSYQLASVKAAANPKDATSTIAPSKEASPAIGGGGGGGSTDSQRNTQPLDSTQSTTSSTAPRRTRHAAADPYNLLQQSIQLAERFGGEYMDTTPLQGEPGSFVMKKAAPARLADAAAKGAGATGAGAGAAKGATGSTNTAAPTPAPSSALAATRPGAPTMAPLQTDFPDDERRRKAATFNEKSPATASPLTPSGTKRRKKSKAGPSAGGKATPTTTVA